MSSVEKVGDLNPTGSTENEKNELDQFSRGIQRYDLPDGWIRVPRRSVFKKKKIVQLGE